MAGAAPAEVGQHLCGWWTTITSLSCSVFSLGRLLPLAFWLACLTCLALAFWPLLTQLIIPNAASQIIHPGPPNVRHWIHRLRWLNFGLLVVGGLVGIAGFAMLGMRAYFAQPQVTYNNNLRVIDFGRNPYEIGKRFFINMYLQYDGAVPAKIRADYTISYIPDFTKQYPTDDARAMEEDALWEMRSRNPVPVQAPSLVPPKMASFKSLVGAIQTPEVVRALSSGTLGAAVIFMGSIRWTEGDEDVEYETEFCGYTQAAPTFVMCRNHNGPVGQRARR